MSPLQPRALFYRSLAQLLGAGASVAAAMDFALAQLPAKERARAQAVIAPALARGEPISGALRAAGVVPAAHVRYLMLAEKSGHVDGLLTALADFTEELLALRRTLISGLMLPAVYLTAAAFIAPLPALLLGGSLAHYLWSSLGLLALIAGVAVLIVLCLRHAPATLLDRMLTPLPVVGPLWRELDYSDLARTLALLARTSVGLIEAVQLAAEMCRSPRLRDALCAAAREAAARGVPVGPQLRASGALPVEMVALWETGEQSGQLDQTFPRLATYYSERCRHRLAELARWLPRIGYLTVAGYMALEILRLAGAYVAPLTLPA